MKLEPAPVVPRAVTEKAAEPPRLLIYSHDTFGLGHFRRCLKIAKAFNSAYPQSAILIVTGQQQAERYRLPEGTDFIKLPAVVKVGESRYQPRSLGSSFEKIFELRQNLISEAIRTFQPHIFLVDHAPLGMKGEIKKTLQELKAKNSSPALVLGLRDILDEPEKVCAAWETEGVYPVLDEVYDRIFIYGTSKFFDPVSEYRFGCKAREKTDFTGFISDGNPSSSSPAKKVGRSARQKILLTIGGGEDGMEIVYNYLVMLKELGDEINAATTIVLGPFMQEKWRRMLIAEAIGLPVRFEEFLPELAPHFEKADLVISMGGYNTVVEILSSARKALIIPRIYPRKEQLLRAQRLSELGLVNYISPVDLSPGKLFDVVYSMINDPTNKLFQARKKNPLPLDGAAKLAELCHPLLTSRGVLK
ncbi:MAG: glycosyltransferase [candidate division Zixibacteria bacterium]|nr:glycosyltransferase [candidate division Zixibacteria bacterium]